MTISVHPSSFTQLALGLEPRRRAQAPVAPQGAPCGSGSQSADAFDAAGRAIGRDYARHGLMPSPDHLYPGVTCSASKARPCIHAFRRNSSQRRTWREAGRAGSPRRTSAACPASQPWRTGWPG